MTVLVVFALEWEFMPWRHGRAFGRHVDASGCLFEANIGAARVVVGFAGVGAKRLPPMAATVFTRGLAACVSSGLGGALGPHLAVGDIVAAHQVRSHADSRSIDSDPHLVRVAERCGARSVGRFVTSSRVMIAADEKGRTRTTGDVVEMEGVAVLREAGTHGVPAIAIRAIGDAHDETMPLDFNRVIRRDGGISIGRVVTELCRRPRAIPAMIRFGARNRAATERLAEFLDQYVQRIASSPCHSVRSN